VAEMFVKGWGDWWWGVRVSSDVVGLGGGNDRGV